VPAHRSRPRALITGLGAVSPIGVGVPAFTRSLRQGRSGISLIGFTHPDMKSTVAGRCVDFDPVSAMNEGDCRRLPRLITMALAAAREAMAHAGLPIGDQLGVDLSRRVGLVLGTGAGGIDFTLDQFNAHHLEGGRASLWTITNATHGNLAGELSIHLGLRGPSLCISTGCASSSDAAGLAMDLLRSDREGTPDALVVVGADAHIRWETLHGMELLRVITTRDWKADPQNASTASRPFDRTRDGFVLSEGAWAMVIEREQFAGEREAREGDPPLGELLGYGATCDAYHRVRPDPDMQESARAMTLAIADAGLAPDQIEIVHYHGTSTQVNDAQETGAVKLAFGPHAPRLRGHSVKSMIGHPQGAGGLAAMVATVASLTAQDGGEPFLFPTINLREPDPTCDLDYTPNHAAPTHARTALVNCLAFGAKNSALVVRAGVPVPSPVPSPVAPHG
jgi:3-oxoacyl-[acyl-carrier-protein] synthase II